MGGEAAFSTSAFAASENVLTVHIEEQTGWVKNFNPFDAAGRRSSTTDFIYEPLVIFNQFDGGKPVFRLATAYSFSEDLLSLTFTIRDGVMWSDGQPLTAEDVVYSLELALSNAAVDLVGLTAAVSGVQQVGNSDVKLTLKAINSLLPEALGGFSVVPKHIWKDVPNPATFANETPVGSGPMTEIRRFTSQVYEQARNPHYWDAASLKVDVMRFPQISGNDQMLAALPTVGLDWFGSFLPDIDKTYVALDSEHNAYWQPPGDTVSFDLNWKAAEAGNNEAFNDINFRHAFSLTLDRKSMVDVAGFGYPTANGSATGLPQTFESWRNADAGKDADKWVAFDLDGASKAFDAAGYDKRDGEGFRLTKSGKPIKFSIIVPTGWTDWIDDAQIAIEGLRKAGINATVATPPFTQYVQHLLDGSYDVAMHARPDGATPFDAYYGSYSSDLVGKTRHSASRYTNPKLDSLFADFRGTADDAKRHAIFNDIQVIIANDFPVIPAFNNPIWYQYCTKRFSGFLSKDTPTMNPENHDNNHMRLMHLLQLSPVA
ncbi:ABC transporter substrate-binding protein [Mesorhizobium sp. B2-4-15]|uniref:ABC transporter substrate-binding protein n=1 Tax=Mesorhizobium sp. B2-4-15 TaxID=2589934 RepID=UPI001FEF5976|nr:ABC transporter substrate-binding protein [Mesorhizobium sp. B2-4-15]